MILWFPYNLPQPVVLEKNYLILLAFASCITSPSTSYPTHGYHDISGIPPELARFYKTRLAQQGVAVEHRHHEPLSALRCHYCPVFGVVAGIGETAGGVAAVEPIISPTNGTPMAPTGT